MRKTMCRGTCRNHWLPSSILIIYGFSIYYSEANDCDKYPDTSFFSSMMFVILFIGYIMIFVYVMMLCTVPCVYMFLRDGGQPQR
jgi:hypothetical protein